VQARLGRRADAENESGKLELVHAQFLVARSLGFKNWDQLVKDVEELRPLSGS
jgi:hypothetical protein